MHQSQEHKGGKRGGHKPDILFGGGTGLGGSDQVLEGIAADVSPEPAITVAAAWQHGERHSFGPGPKYRHRLRYWGGHGDDVPPPDDDDPPGDDDLPPSGDDDVTPPFGGGNGSGTTAFLLESGERCDDHLPGKLSGWDRFAGSNGGRVDKIIARYSPEFLGGRYMTAALLVANYQEELEKRKPDVQLAGTYLGLFLKGPVTVESVKEINFGLCVAVDRQQAREIAGSAEVQRLAAK